MEKLINSMEMKAGFYLLADGKWHDLIVTQVCKDGIAFLRSPRGVGRNVFQIPIQHVMGYSQGEPK